jgi:hypothetical protein
MLTIDAQPYPTDLGMAPLLMGFKLSAPPATVVLRHCSCSHMDTVVLRGEWDLDTLRGFGDPVVYTEAGQVGVVAYPADL